MLWYHSVVSDITKNNGNHTPPKENETTFWYHFVVSNMTQREWNLLWYHYVVLDMTQRERNPLWYHSITPSSHIYPSNQQTRVNMWQEVTMIWFDSLCVSSGSGTGGTHHTKLPHQQHNSQEPSQPLR